MSIKRIKAAGLKRCCRREAWLSIVAISAVLVYGLWPLLTAPNDYYPMTVDGMGHLAKIQYIADSLRELKWPAWFPYWYNGSTVMQYYPPLSYLLLVPVQIVFDNVMITYKFFGFFSLLVGAVGVWLICRRFIGSWVGIWAGIVYAINPFILRSLFLSGLIAQGPIFALSPWFLYFSLLFFKNKTKINWLAVCLITALLILSHAMHAFMVAIIIAIVGLALLILHLINIKELLLWGLAVSLGAALVSFWWVPGVTQWENPGIPNLLSEAVAIYTAKTNWFTLQGREASFLYFGSSLLIIALLTIPLPLMLQKQAKKETMAGQTMGSSDYRWMYCMVIGLAASVVFSFGNQVPGFKYIPMHENLVTGRVLSLSAVLAAIISAYFIWLCQKHWNQGYQRLLCIIIIAVSMIFVLIDYNPRQISFTNDYCLKQKRDLDLIPAEKNPCKNGRFAWVMPVNSDTTYFPLLKNLYMTDGWNIEGTPHNQAIWQHNIANSNDCNDYIIRNLLFWNTRSAYISNNYTKLTDALIKQGFQSLEQDAEKSILFNPSPPSYYLKQDRDALVIGKRAIDLEMHFPWMLRGYSPCLEDFSPEYLAPFNLIYLIEPEVRDIDNFQKSVAKLATDGKMVIVSMGREKLWPLLDVFPYWENIEARTSLQLGSNAPFTGAAWLEADPLGQLPALGNLDELWAKVQNGDKVLPAIGYKWINGHKVYFVGLALDQQLNSPEGKKIALLLEQLMDLAQPHKSIVPQPFPVLKDTWQHDGFSFSYETQEATSVLVSVTYTPRWGAKLDGKTLSIENLDNLVYIKLPMGKHQVSFHYGFSWVAKLGIALSLLSLLMLVAGYYGFNYIYVVLNKIELKIRRFISRIGE